MQTNIVLGGGQAGVHAAISMRRAGFEGRIVMIGDEAELPYDRTTLSKSYITTPDGAVLSYFFDAATLSAERIDFLCGTRAVEIDPAAERIATDDGRHIAYDRLVIATGSHARRLDIPGFEHVLTLRTHQDADQLRKRLVRGARVVCIGGGVIGLEIASAARAQGCDVTVVELGTSVMSRSLDEELAGHIGQLHRAAGVEIVYDARITAVHADSVVFEDGTSLVADLIVAGVGAVKNVALAERAGIEVRHGILTDAGGRTSVDRIFCAGEVAEYYSARIGHHLALESWRHAQEHGTFVGRAAAGIEGSYDEVPWFWSDQHAVNIQVAGDAKNATRRLYRGDPATGSFSVFLLDAQGLVSGAFALNAGRDISAAIRLMRKGDPVDPQLVTDPSVSLQRLLSARTLSTRRLGEAHA